jgi:hypothetical protein
LSTLITVSLSSPHFFPPFLSLYSFTPYRLKQVMTIRLFLCVINELERHFAQETQLNLLKR